jgi:hypothetical protein
LKTLVDVPGTNGIFRNGPAGGLKKPFLPATQFRMLLSIAGHAFFWRIAVSIGHVISPSTRADRGAHPGERSR